jgi:hypothetical protein
MPSDELRLLVDHCGFGELRLVEGTDGNRLRFTGKFQEADAVNKNKRSYPFSVLDENIKKLQESIKDRRLIGELDHPTDSIVHFAAASHLITKLWWEGNILMGEAEVLNTPHGKILKALINDGVKIGISSRGVGNGKVNENGILVIGESYKLITFDAVADPSTFAAFQEKVVSNEETTSKEIVEKPISSVVRNESSCIATPSKEAIIACLGGIVKSNVDQIKARLK